MWRERRVRQQHEGEESALSTEREDSIKPGVERSGTPGSMEHKGRAHEVGDSTHHLVNHRFLSYRTLRALRSLILRYPGVSLRSTPGFMLAPAARVFDR